MTQKQQQQIVLGDCGTHLSMLNGHNWLWDRGSLQAVYRRLNECSIGDRTRVHCRQLQHIILCTPQTLDKILQVHLTRRYENDRNTSKDSYTHYYTGQNIIFAATLVDRLTTYYKIKHTTHPSNPSHGYLHNKNEGIVPMQAGILTCVSFL